MENIEKSENFVSQKTSAIFCPKCLHSLKEYIETGFVGCEHCYKVFYEQIDKYIKDFQVSNIHTGKMYIKGENDYAK